MPRQYTLSPKSHSPLKHTDLQRQNLKLAIQSDADSCVMCGMCQPYCPTYQVHKNEAESPRGRISIIQAYSQGRIAADANMIQHLEHCVGCMACQAMCPSNVAYGRIIDNAHTLLANHKNKPRFAESVLLKTIARTGGLGRFARALNIYQRSGAQFIVSKFLQLAGMQAAARANNVLRFANTTSLKQFYPASGTAISDVALFTGCLGTGFDATTLLSSIYVLTRLGYNVHIPAAQNCCGALHQHQGATDAAQQLIQHNRSVFGALPVTHIIYTANGCGAQLAQADMPVNVIDICRFILSTPAITTTGFKSLHAQVLIHESCSSLNKLKLKSVTQQLLHLIPQLTVDELDRTPACCGAGGLHSLQFPEQARALAHLKLRKLDVSRQQYLVSDNLGCALHFKNTLDESGIKIDVIHPVTLLARQLD